MLMSSGFSEPLAGTVQGQLFDFISNWISNKTIEGHIELEARIGSLTWSDGNHFVSKDVTSDGIFLHHQGVSFKPGVNEAEFESIRNTLASMTTTSEIFDSYDIIHKNGRITLNPQTLQIEECIEKNSRLSLEMLSPSSQFDLRFTIADEAIRNPEIVSQSSYKSERLKQRHSFFFGSMRVDMTRTYERYDREFKKKFNGPSYEIELEYVDGDFLLQEWRSLNEAKNSKGGSDANNSKNSTFVEIVLSFISFSKKLQEICSNAVQKKKK